MALIQIGATAIAALLLHTLSAYDGIVAVVEMLSVTIYLLIRCLRGRLCLGSTNERLRLPLRLSWTQQALVETSNML